jgi:predicted CXXCH cytochrome family protein
MKSRIFALGLGLAAILTVACSAAARHKGLTLFFDGVPPPKAARPAEGSQAASAPVPSSRKTGYGEHGPYAAKLCGACHESGATNSLVLPRDELCARCHVIDLDRKFVHGPLASGGCLLCHDPHSSQYRHLLVSDSDSFCFRCHDRAAVAKIDGHAGMQEDCTTCHDAHGSDTKYLLK